MYGWRARIGLIVPSSNTTNESEFWKWAPDGVSIHTTRMPLVEVDAEEQLEMAEEIERWAEFCSHTEPDVLAYGCTTGSLVHGAGYDEEIERRLEDEVGIQSVSTARAVKLAFKALDADDIAIVTPYPEDIDERERQYLEENDFSVVTMGGCSLRQNTDVGSLSPERVYSMTRETLESVEDYDAVFLSCTNMPTFEVIDAIETDFGVPVVNSNQATLWACLQTAGISQPLEGLGELFKYEYPALVEESDKIPQEVE